MPVLICGACGGPLPRPGSERYVTCGFCAATTDLASDIQRSTAASTENVVDAIDRFEQQLVALEASYIASLDGGSEPRRALRDAAESATSALCDPDVLANVVFALVVDFDRASGTSVARHPHAVPRLVRAYFTATQELRRKETYEINLPFFAVTDQGPVHFLQRVSAARLQQLASAPPTDLARPPAAAPPTPAATSATASAAPPARGKPWWKKLFD